MAYDNERLARTMVDAATALIEAVTRLDMTQPIPSLTVLDIGQKIGRAEALRDALIKGLGPDYSLVAEQRRLEVVA